MEIPIDDWAGHKSPQEDDAYSILALDPDNKLGFGKNPDKVLESLKTHSKNGVHHYVIKNGSSVPVALIKDDLSGDTPSVRICISNAGNQKIFERVLEEVDHFEDPENFKVRKQLQSIVNFAETTGIDPSSWKSSDSLEGTNSQSHEDQLLGQFADEIIVLSKSKNLDSEEILATIRDYSTKEGMEVCWDKLGDLCARKIMAESLSRRSSIAGRADQWVDKIHRVGEEMNKGFERGVLENLGDGAQNFLRKLADAFELIGKALGKTIDQLIDKLSRACGAIGDKLGLDGQKIQTRIKDGFVQEGEKFKDGATSFYTALKNPVQALAASGVTAAFIPLVEKLNQSGLNSSEALFPGSGDFQVQTLGVMAVLLASSPVILGVRDWAKKKKEDVGLAQLT